MVAFVGSIVPFAQRFTSSFTPRLTSLQQNVRLPKLYQPARMAMNDAKPGAIDFGAVDATEAGKSLSGLVFSKGDITSNDDVESRCRINYPKPSEDIINEQINVEYTAFYAYSALAAYFGRDTVALKGFAAYFRDQATEERGHAEKFIEYQNSRGGKVVLKPLAVPELQFDEVDGTSDAIYASAMANTLENFVLNKLLHVSQVANENDDYQLSEFNDQMLDEQTKACKEAADQVALLKRIGTGHGIYHYDTQLQEKFA